jgi:hypothetical protein
MPPWLLVRHLTFKFYVRHIRDHLRRPPARLKSAGAKP